MSLLSGQFFRDMQTNGAAEKLSYGDAAKTCLANHCGDYLRRVKLAHGI
jgi:hypothetical protein